MVDLVSLLNYLRQNKRKRNIFDNNTEFPPLNFSNNLSFNFLEEWLQKWFQFILDNPNKDWNYEVLCRNLNVTLAICSANFSCNHE